MVIASIDLMAGKVVQLRQGKEKILEFDDALSLARKFDRYGEIAVIDLDAAMARGENIKVIKDILKIAECRVGGGIRTVEKAKELISLGAKKIIIGSRGFEKDKINHRFLKKLGENIGKQRIIIAIDALNGKIVTEGWKHKTTIDVEDAISELADDTSEILFTCVEKEGTMEGINQEMVKRLINKTKKKITVAGGIASIEEVRELAKLGVDVQLGMALYTKKIDLSQAFIESLNWHQELIPTITQDIANQVLMLAYSNKDSLKRTFETERMWYFSRSRNALWMKGETSSNEQRLIRMRADCDRDTILATIRQKGFACHTGNYSCFTSEKIFSLDELLQIVKDRITNFVPDSYTAKLDKKLLCKKILEEANELIEARERNAIIWETADLFYFITVLLARNGVEMAEVIDELRRRRR